MLKKLVIILAAILVLLLPVAIWEPVMDALPIDQSRWVTVDGITYHRGEKGDRDFGWYEEDGHVYYLDPAANGARVSGEMTIEGSRYHFAKDGRMSVGWQETAQGLRWYDDRGVLGTGWQSTQEGSFYLDAEGYAYPGWQDIEGSRYCMDEKGIVRTGWYDEGENRYYLGQDGAMVTGRFTLDGVAHYTHEATGLVLSGWQDIGGSRYLLDDRGAAFTGWQEVDGNRYLLGENGAAITGWHEEGDDRYYLDQNGAMVTGWIEDGGNKYYLQSDGTAAKGTLEIDGSRFFFTSTGANIIMVNRWNPMPEDYQADIVPVRNVRVDSSCAEALEAMASACEAAGHGLWIRSSYRTNYDQTYLLEDKIKRVMAQGYNEEDAYDIAIESIAIPGTSEHQLGLAVDIVDLDYTLLNRQQCETDTQKWLMEHCWEYGFILRYPDGTTEITGVIYEPWHYRYVGTELSLELRDLGITLEEYLDNLTGDGTTCGGKGR